jgi:hypothetical protein
VESQTMNDLAAILAVGIGIGIEKTDLLQIL